MPRYVSAAEIASFLSQGGWPDDELITATAVSLAESSGQVDADNGIAAGLMGINYKVHDVDVDKLKDDPVYNTSEGYKIFQMQAPANAWSHAKWETFPLLYKTYIPTAKSGVATFHKEGGAGVAEHDLSKTDPFGAAPKEGVDDLIADGTDTIIGAFDSVPKFLSRLGDSIFSRDFWWRVFKVLVGLGLTGLAIHLLLKSTGLESAGLKAAVAAV